MNRGSGHNVRHRLHPVLGRPVLCRFVPCLPLLCLPLLCVPLLCVGCSEEVRSDPSEILTTVTIPDPSILGYVRADVSGINALLKLVEPFREGMEEMPGASMFTQSLPIDMISKVASLAELGSHVTVLFLDPGTFGGGAALHFLSQREGSLVALLDADPRFERLGDDPPEFRLIRERDVGREILGALQKAGFDIEIPGGGFNLRFLVEEGERGTLVLPSYDARRDVLGFLESTDYLSPWEEALVVIDLDIGRLALAYADLLRSIDSSIRKMATLRDAQSRSTAPLTPGRVLRFWSVSVFGFLGGLDGVRFASSRPGHEGAELRLQAAEGGTLDRIMEVLREDGPSMTGVITGGLSLQLNVDPAAVDSLLRDAADFYSAQLDIPREALRPVTESCIDTFERDRGMLLYGAGFTGDTAWAGVISRLEEGTDTAAVVKTSDAFWAAWAALGGREATTEPLSGWGSFRRHGRSSGVAIEAGAARDWSLSMIRNIGDREKAGRPGDLPVRLLRLCGVGIPPGRSLPRKSQLYTGYSFMPATDGLSSAVGLLLPLKLSGHGYGTVEGNDLVVVYPHR